ncbi:iron(III) transport system permease protein [Halovenus aranensis]|jgi:iron(III) transport system permease protein|uniref:Iron(III) transport system permease protein n=1 Tax=Halovenus aranensis TaxID=890420 RepID=A0A1G8VTU6_9EURY|nr:iron ABC transporter permease [Halovenus aranensis]SDJ69474.1 iron(III) transport system permease protein [Halovenus aranensis]
MRGPVAALRAVRRQFSRDELPLGLTLLCGVIAASMVFPVSWLFIKAFQVERGRAVDLVVQQETLDILVNSLLLMGGVTGFSVLLGVPLAYLTTRTNLPFRRFWTVIVALPLVIPSYIGAFTFVSAFGPRGEFQDLLAPFGVERVPEIYGLGGATLVITLYTYPYVYLTARAALLTLDTSLLEAARTLNHSRWEAFKRVTLPHIRSATAAGGLLAALYAVSDFGTPAIMRLPVFTRQIYVENDTFGTEYAALLALHLLGIVLVVLALEQHIRSDDRLDGDTSNPAKPVDLGRWRWPALVFPLAVTGLALLVPIWILLLWVVRADTAGGRSELAFELGHVINSVEVAGAAAILSAMAAIPIAYYAARHRSWLSTIFERTTYIGFAVPGIVLALSLVFFGTDYAPAFYQTVPMLVFAYVVRFMSQAVGIIRSGTQQVDPTLVEAARTLGESSLGAFRRVTLPLISSSVVAGMALVFLTTMKELPVTLVLRPTGFETIVTQIWRAQSNLLYQYAAVPALLLLAISGISMVILLSQGGQEGL